MLWREGYLSLAAPRRRRLSFVLVLLAWGSVSGVFAVTTGPTEEHNAPEEASPPHPLYAAILKNDLATVQAMVDRDSTLLEANLSGGQFPLFFASRLGKSSIVRFLLEKQGEVDRACCEGWTPLMIAAAEGQEEVAGLLLRQGAKPNTVNNYGRTALMYAARYGLSDVVSQLLAHGADPNIRDLDGLTAILVAARYTHEDVLKQLISSGATVTEQECMRERLPSTCAVIGGFQLLQDKFSEAIVPLRSALERGEEVHTLLAGAYRGLGGNVETVASLLRIGCAKKQVGACALETKYACEDLSAASGLEVLPVTGLATLPTKVYSPPPEYPEEAWKQGVTGAVELAIVVDKQGKVAAVRVLQGLPSGLSEAAVAAVHQWKYEPARLEGEPVVGCVHLKINFKIPEPEEPKP